MLQARRDIGIDLIYIKILTLNYPNKAESKNISRANARTRVCMYVCVSGVIEGKHRSNSVE